MDRLLARASPWVGARTRLIYHITSRAEWLRAQRRGEYQARSLRREGFIHCSGRTQVVGVANAFYRGRRDLLLLVIDPARVRAAIHYERVDGRRFPHIYGPVNLEAVVRVLDFPPRADGMFATPEWAPSDHTPARPSGSVRQTRR